ncbi:creatininase family protein [Pseudonocardia acaciae]|uniref:creatininase family protein n=1 Tax=Pseudonocardia acaciae TaxID=551276 RepID=UPI000688F9D1|nr:creatininase family protein [Pseudonocardia acaciae]
MSVWIHDLTFEEVAAHLERHREVLVPIGSTEVHGPHLPLGTDGYQAIDYAEAIAERAGLLVAPPIWYGDAAHHMHKPGTISLRPETVIALLKDVYRSLAEHGFRAIVTFNGHRLANLPVIGIASREVKREFPHVAFASIDPLSMSATHRELREHGGRGLHGDEFETSHMLLRHPELVHMDRAVFSHGYVFETRFLTQDLIAGGDAMQYYLDAEEQGALAPLGHIGDPERATAGRGEALFDAVVANGVEFVTDLRRWVEDGRRVAGAIGDEGRALMERELAWRARGSSTVGLRTPGPG